MLYPGHGDDTFFLAAGALVLSLIVAVADHLRRVRSGTVRPLRETPKPYSDKYRIGFLVVVLLLLIVFLRIAAGGMVSNDPGLAVLGLTLCFACGIGVYILLVRGSSINGVVPIAPAPPATIFGRKIEQSSLVWLVMGAVLIALLLINGVEALV